jgi:hypothetical protein
VRSRGMTRGVVRAARERGAEGPLDVFVEYSFDDEDERAEIDQEVRRVEAAMEAEVQVSRLGAACYLL